MGRIKPPLKVKPIFGVLYKEQSLFDTILQRLEAHFSPADCLSDPFSFSETDYYAEEMGPVLIRRYFSLRDLMDPTLLVHLKHLSNLWEEEFSENGNRRINLDPGYITLSNLILASTKNFSHRLYLGRGIYGEVTLRYEHGSYTRLPWTYPDYWNHLDVLHGIRRIYRDQLRHGEEENLPPKEKLPDS